MLFRRRSPLNWWQRLRHLLWPRSGWSRAARYVWHRLARLKDSPHGIAAGVSSGVAISFTPFIGFHLIGAMGLALATRGNLLAAWVGTLIGNPWTFPIIWVTIHKIGSWILGIEAGGEEAERLSLDLLIHRPGAALAPLLLPMAVGGLPLALASWFLSYWPIRKAIERFQERRRRKLRLRQSGERGGMEDPDNRAERV